MAVNEMTSTIVVCDPADRTVKTFNYTGDLLHRFEPSGIEDGLACVPAGIHVLLSGEICVCDSLNHTVSEETQSADILLTCSQYNIRRICNLTQIVSEHIMYRQFSFRLVVA